MAKDKIKSLGKNFGEMIVKGKTRRFRGNDSSFDSFDLTSFLDERAIKKKEKRVSDWRFAFFYFVLILSFIVIFGRLFVLQVIEGKVNLLRSENNRIQIQPIHAPRGVIFDQKGEILARNTAGFRLILGNDVKIVDRDTALDLESKGLVSEGLEEKELGRLEIDSIRQYPANEASAHLLGYISQISADEYKGKYSNYEIGDRVGRVGIEETYENYLKGKDGGRLVEVDAKGKEIRLLGEKEPKAGNNLYTSIDLGLQNKMYEALTNQVAKTGSVGGVAIAQNPQTGEILGLVSYPSYDANKIVIGLKTDEFSKLVSDTSQPMFNRALSGTYPPGSIFKIATSLSGLESKKIDKDTQIEDTGEIFLGEYRFSNWYFNQYGKKEGMLNIVTAIKRSNDVFFYRLGQLVGEKILGDWAKKLGLGEKLGIDMPGEASGLVPTEEWKKKVKGEIWMPGDTLHMAIGQGDVLATPLQILNMTSFVANNGTLFKPRIVEKIEDQNGKVIKNFNDEVLAKNLVEKKNLDLVREGMKEACAEGGTGWTFFDFSKKHPGIDVACKTGTAEAGANPHAWFTVFAPFDKPKIALTVLVENSGEGSSISGPVAREILDWYFTSQK
jgi:penicillin-binding protein 2